MNLRKSNKINKSERLLVALCAVQVLHETMDDLRETEFYKQSFKQALNHFEKELTRIWDPHIAKIFNQDEEIFNAIMEGIVEINKQVALLSPAVIAKVGLTIQQENQKHYDELE